MIPIWPVNLAVEMDLQKLEIYIGPLGKTLAISVSKYSISETLIAIFFRIVKLLFHNSLYINYIWHENISKII